MAGIACLLLALWVVYYSYMRIIRQKSKQIYLRIRKDTSVCSPTWCKIERVDCVKTWPNKQTEKQMERWPNKQTDRQTDGYKES